MDGDQIIINASFEKTGCRHCDSERIGAREMIFDEASNEE